MLLPSPIDKYVESIENGNPELAKKQREEFEENVFTLIEDTCTKLASSNFDN